MVRRIALLGSTGSIGTQTLDVVRDFPDQLEIVGLAAGRNIELLQCQVEEFKPPTVSAVEPLDITQFPFKCTWLPGEQGMVDMVTRPDVDLVVIATTGSAGLLSTLAALGAGKLVALANKEVLVSAGHIIEEQLKTGDGELVPIDSEHSAIWQCLQGEPSSSVERLTLTASGGALRALSATELRGVTAEQALRHPTWTMGHKITIDSATLMNKGLEVIEARWLFGVPMSRIDVVLHPQSLVHSVVTFSDSSCKAQLGLPDMRLPIQYALSHPERWTNEMPRLDLAAAHDLQFGAVDMERYPALQLALKAGEAAGVYPAVLCAADEIAVDAFLTGEILFTDISSIIAGTLDRAVSCASPNLDQILEADAQARRDASALVRHA